MMAFLHLEVFILSSLAAASVHRACSEATSRVLPFCNTSLSIDERVADLVARIDPAESGALLTARHSAPVSRLGLPAYDWGVNSIHGDQVSCGTNCATNYPLPNAIGAAFNVSLVRSLASMMAKELRALRLEGSCEKHRRRRLQEGTIEQDACIGLDTWAPNININRDPRWGRNWEVATEDPFWNGEIGAAYATGFQQGDSEAHDDRFLKGVITLKHWCAYNVEANRSGYDSRIPAFDLGGTYLPSFRRAVRRGGAAGIMCSYNSINGVPTCANAALNSLLRDTWKFDGYITSDSGAISDIFHTHKFVTSAPKAAAAAILAGVDINSGSVYSSQLKYALDAKLLNMSAAGVGGALMRSFRMRLRLGLFDDSGDQPYEHFAPSIVGSASHIALSLDASRQGLTLLRNEGGALPLRRVAGRRIVVIGPSGDGAGAKALMAGGTGGCGSGSCLDARVVCKCANSHDDWCCVKSTFEAIVSAAGTDANVSFATGCSLHSAWDPHATQSMEAIELAVSADDIVLVLGGDWQTDHEGMDRSSIALPGGQIALATAVKAAAPHANIVTVLIHGGQMDISPLFTSSAAVLDAFYPGIYGAQAIAEALFGDLNPGGKLPATVYRAGFLERVDMNSFEMARPPGRGYRFLAPDDPDVLFGFGYGLSYTNFSLAVDMNAQPTRMSNVDETTSVRFMATVKNTGGVIGSETVLAFWRPLGQLAQHPFNASYMPLRRQLFAFQRTAPLAPGATATVSFLLEVDEMVLFDRNGSRTSRPGQYEVMIGTGPAQAAAEVALPFSLTGEVRVLEALPSALVQRAPLGDF